MPSKPITTVPRKRNVCMVRADKKEVNAARKARWGIVEYAGNMPTAKEIADQAMRML